MRWRWSVRARTTAAAVAVLAPVLVVAGAAGVSVQRDDLTEGVATVATAEARSVVRGLADGSLTALPGGEEDVVQVVSVSDGAVLMGSREAADSPIAPPPSGDDPETRAVRGVVVGEPDRYLAVTLRAEDGASYVVVARSLESVHAATGSTTGILSVGGLLVLLVVGLLTWLTTGRALSPVESMRRRAASIPADDLSGRLPVPSTGDEVARLATTINALLERVDASTQTQRRFIADASHELRSPVATIRALVESDRISAHPGGRDGLSAEILDEIEHLTTLVDDLLRLARGDARPPNAVSVVDLADTLREEVRRTRRVPIDARVAPGLYVDADADGLGRCVRNLLDNAERHATSRIAVRAFTGRDSVRLEVADDGVGVPAEDRARIFERFVRLDDARSRSVGGTGLGLAIVEQMVTDLGGTVHVEDAHPGVRPPGARFVVILPGAVQPL